MKKELLELVTELIAHNEKELLFAKGNGIPDLINYYQGKVDAYKIIEDYAK